MLLQGVRHEHRRHRNWNRGTIALWHFGLSCLMMSADIVLDEIRNLLCW